MIEIFRHIFLFPRKIYNKQNHIYIDRRLSCKYILLKVNDLMMKTIGVLLLVLHVLQPCNAFYASPVITISGKALGSTNPLGQAAEILNVTQPGKI